MTAANHPLTDGQDPSMPDHQPTDAQPLSADSPVAEPSKTVDLDALQRAHDDWKDKAYRATAELENFRRRATQEAENNRNFAIQSFAKDLLPVADNFARALTTPEGNEKALRDGVTLVAANLQKIFEKHGITKIKTTPGDAPHHDLHQVMSQVPSTHPTGHVVEILQQGFQLNGRLLRPAFVSVSTGPDEQPN